MTRTETICDRCGARKGDSDGWWKAWVTENSFTVQPDGKGDYKDYCNDNCVMKALQDFMDTRRNISEEKRIVLENHDEVVKEFEHSYDKEFDK